MITIYSDTNPFNCGLRDDIRIVTLEELVKRDHSLNDLFDLNYGEEAERKTLGKNGHEAVLKMRKKNKIIWSFKNLLISVRKIQKHMPVKLSCKY